MINRLWRQGLVCVCALLSAGTPALAQKTWSGAAGTGSWNSSGNWSPSGVPDNKTNVIFDDSGAISPFISIDGKDASANSITFSASSVNYALSSTAASLITSKITRAQTAGVAPAAIGLDGPKTGSLLFPGASLLIDNEVGPTDLNSPTLIIGSPTVIGSLTGAGGVTFTGTGATVFGGSFTTSANLVTAGLAKSGSGMLNLSGNNSGLSGTVNVSGGTLRLDYSSNTGNKLGAGSSSPNGSLALSGANLVLQGNASLAVTQSVSGTGGTVLNPGQSNISLATGTGSLTLDLHAINRPVAGGTLDIDVSQPLTSVATTNTAVNGILSPWMTVNHGATWGTIAGGNIVPFNSFINGIGSGNSDISGTVHTGSASSTNSLRFSDAGDLVCDTELTIQSGGILVTSAHGGTIEGARIRSDAEIVLQTYNNLNIYSNINAFAGLTKTGPGILSLGGTIGLSGAFNINQGSVTFSSLAALPSGKIYLNDRSGALQSLSFFVIVYRLRAQFKLDLQEG